MACVGNAKTAHTRCIRTIASGGAHSRNRITQLFRFIRPANVRTNNRNFFIRTVRSSGPKHNPRIALTRLYVKRVTFNPENSHDFDNRWIVT